MEKLSFLCIIDDDLCDIEPFEPYAELYDFELGLALISFDEDEAQTIRNIFKENGRCERALTLDNIRLEGSDGYLYTMSQTSLDKKEKTLHSIKRSYKQYYNFKLKTEKAKEWINKNCEKHDNGLIKLRKSRFSAYKFIDKENEMCFPFRLLERGIGNKPLFVLFHGAGAMGNDNIKQLFDHLPLYKQILKAECNILIPQAPFGSNRGYASTQSYVKSVKKLIDELPIDFDRNRIYLVGTSFGGFCVWHLTYLFPDCFAAAVPVMGGLSFDFKFDKYDIERLTKTPFWIAHSSDDTNVRIDSDDYFAGELEKLGADIKYTRRNKYGHTMYRKFYKTEKWAEWCLSKELKDE